LKKTSDKRRQLLDKDAGWQNEIYFKGSFEKQNVSLKRDLFQKMNLKPFLTILTIQTLVIGLSAQQAENNNTINNNKLKPLVNRNEVKKAKLTNSVYQVNCNY
jgi:hypothetical protein